MYFVTFVQVSLYTKLMNQSCRDKSLWDWAEENSNYYFGIISQFLLSLLNREMTDFLEKRRKPNFSEVKCLLFLTFNMRNIIFSASRKLKGFI